MVDPFACSSGIFAVTGDGLGVLGGVYLLLGSDLGHEDVFGGQGAVKTVAIVVSEHRFYY